MHKISFKKVSAGYLPINIRLDRGSDFLENDEFIELSGTLRRLENGLVKLDSKFMTNLELVCSISGDVFYKNIEDDLVLLFSDGIWEYQSHKDKEILDIIEFFDGFIDLVYVIESEVQSMKLDYMVKE